LGGRKSGAVGIERGKKKGKQTRSRRQVSRQCCGGKGEREGGGKRREKEAGNGGNVVEGGSVVGVWTVPWAGPFGGKERNKGGDGRKAGPEESVPLGTKKKVCCFLLKAESCSAGGASSEKGLTPRENREKKKTE